MTNIILFLLLTLSFSFCISDNNTDYSTNQFTTSSNEVITGKYTESFSNGKLKVEGNKVNGKREGVWTSYYENGKINSENNYVDDTIDGISKIYYENGNLRYTGVYQKGKKIEIWYFYNIDGKFLKEFDFNKNN